MNNSDPTSYNYDRIYNRPKINWKKILIYVSVFFALLCILNYSLNFLMISIKIKILAFILYFIICFTLNLKNLLIFFIKIYQKFAPISIRMNCRFEPSCSNYMIMAIEKYGVISGVKKGILRIKRCNVNNGGYDYP